MLPSLIRSKKRAHAMMNFIHVFFSIGALAGPLLIGGYLNLFGRWRSSLTVALAPSIVLLIWTLRIRLPLPSADPDKRAAKRRFTEAIR